MLESDLQLKKDTARFTSPGTPEGKAYWNKLCKKADELLGTDTVTIPTLTRPWIVPNEIIIRETADSAYIYKATLKVMLEQDYIIDAKKAGGIAEEYSFNDPRLRQLNDYSSQIIRELIIPKLTHEINTSKRYASLRQVYYSLILAQWFKARFSGKRTAYTPFIDKRILNNLTSKAAWLKTDYFHAYQQSFMDGEHSSKGSVPTMYGQRVRSCFSGGEKLFLSGMPGYGAERIDAGTGGKIVSVPARDGQNVNSTHLVGIEAQPTDNPGEVVIQPGRVESVLPKDEVHTAVTDEVVAPAITKLKEVRHLLTYNCNLRCKHCYMRGGEHPDVRPAKFTQEQADEFYGRYRPDEVSATGGEPMLEYEQMKILARATARYGGALEVVTNGWYLTEERVRELNDLNPKTFYQISLDGLEAYHDYLRDKPGAFKKAMAAIDRASSSGHLTKVRVTVSDDNMDEIPALIELLDGFGRKNITLVMRPAVSSGRARDNNIAFSGERSYESLDELKKVAVYITVQTTDNMGKCGCGVNTIAIDPMGNIFPCTYFTFNPKYSMGNIFETGLGLHVHMSFANYNGTCFARKLGVLEEATAQTTVKDGGVRALRRRLPYSAPDYEKFFGTLRALEVIREFCRENFVIEAFYAKGSIAHGVFLKNSDIDHVRIKVNQPLSRAEKVALVDKLETRLKSIGVKELRRVREDDYVRVFHDWEELKGIPNAGTRDFELYPGLDVLTINSLDPVKWMDAVLRKAVLIGEPFPEWIQKVGERIATYFDMEFTYRPNAANEEKFVFYANLHERPGFDVQKEYINITDYSPFSHVNEVSPRYRYKPFLMPFYAFAPGDVRPVHPDTFTDLGLDPAHIDHYAWVYPTSSFRTVYDPRNNVCYKVPLLRNITRGLRDLQDIALQRADYAAQKLLQFPCEGFSFLPEETHYADDPRHNYITRRMPDTEVFPWFYVIASQDFDGAFQMKCMRNMIKTWMFYAAHGLYLEYHTQNLLVDRDANIYYRDLSDIMIHDNGVSDRAWCNSTAEALAISFDRTVCNQNLDHAFRYNKNLGDREREELKALIRSEIARYGLAFPADYSLSFPSAETKRLPVKIPLVGWRAPGSIGTHNGPADGGENPTTGVGGIDFHSLPVVTRAMSSLSLAFPILALNKVDGIPPDEEWRAIRRMLATAVIPSTERIKEYIQRAWLQGELDREKARSCIADILRTEEEAVEDRHTDPVLKELLVALESTS